MLRKLGQNYQFALPKEIVTRLHLHINDYLDARVQGTKIILEPQIVIPKDQAYFYTPEWQKEETQAQEDIKKGRVTKTKGTKELFKELDG
ncbi:MAG: AbrB/MazE/SpoVT family DNA-binding domain-containing protein [Candidatus Omnitrophica bacterium]|nr:AbrB/MazE/SpoVT family DNA-binding domain-containing protein [Candidatus Omnitrophota bacterium]MBU4140593.1 AbrB/MazE/SpoVT family DNA-binding domain-containing protein [Candidatus Omnitrophota bacterium]